MANNADNLGDFKITISVDGEREVRQSIDKIRNGLKGLKSELASVTRAGDKLARVLKSLKAPRVTTGGGTGSVATGGTSVFSGVAKDADRAAKAVTKFGEAIRAAKGDANGLSKGFAKAEHLLDYRVIGGVQRDAAGSVTGRTGLTGVAYSLGRINRQLGGGTKGVGKFASVLSTLVGESKKDPTTGKWTRTGGKALIHSFDSLSKAASGAAKNLAKIGQTNAVGGGAGGTAVNGGAGGQQSWMDKLLGMNKITAKSYSSLGNIIRQNNVGNLRTLNKIASGIDSLANIVSLIRSGNPLLAGASLLMQGVSSIISKNKEYGTEGKETAQDLYKFKKQLDAAGLGYDKVAKRTKDNQLAYAKYKKDENGNVVGIDALATDMAASQAQAARAKGMADSWALFETRGIESPWMTALANQGENYTTVKDYETLTKILEKRYNKAKEAGEDSWAMKQFRTLRMELGDFVKDEDYEAITYSGEKDKDGSWKYKPGIEGFKEKSHAAMGKTQVEGKNLQLAETQYGKIVEQGGAKRSFDSQLEKHTKTMETATGWLEKFTDNCETASNVLGEFSLNLWNRFFGDSDAKPAEEQTKAKSEHRAVLAGQEQAHALRYGERPPQVDFSAINRHSMPTNPIQTVEKMDVVSEVVDNKPATPKPVKSETNIPVSVYVTPEVAPKLQGADFTDFMSSAIKSFLEASEVR